MTLNENKRTILHDSIFDSKFDIGINFQDKGQVIYDHYHDYIELVCQLEGESFHYIDDVLVKLNKNDMLIINTSQLHRNEICNYDVINIVIPEEFLNTMLVESSYDETTILFKSFILGHESIEPYKLNDDSVYILRMLAKLYKNSQSEVMYHFRTKLYLMQFLISLNPLYVQHTISNNMPIDLISYINENMNTASLNEYAKMISYSPSSASQKIKADYNSSFIDILQATRLKSATKLLLSTTKTIDYIMAEIGYSNKTYFYQIFKEHYGITPNQYRKKYKKSST